MNPAPLAVSRYVVRCVLTCLALLAISVLTIPVSPAVAQPPEESPDCCFYQVDGTVYNDLDADGIHDFGEPGLPGWTVQVMDTFNVVLGSTVTDSVGYYIFSPPANCNVPFRLRQVDQTGWTRTAPLAPNYYQGQHFSCSGQIFGPYDFGNTGACPPFQATYTTDAEFNTGVLNGVITNSDQLELAPTGTTFEFAWIANSMEGTLSKVSMVTGREVARYYTGPPNTSNSYTELQPSRTVVDDDGNCWVANRNFGGVASVTQILANGGDDRNSNTVIDTSFDINNDGLIQISEMLPWGQDERVVRHYVVGTGGSDNVARALTLDKTGKLWIGLYSGQRCVQLDPNLPMSLYAPNLTPSAPPELASVPTSWPIYGFALSPSGKIYGSTLSEYAFELDPGPTSGGTGAGPAITQYIDHGGANYGIAVDRNCIVWMAMIFTLSSSDGAVRWDPTIGVGNPSLGFTNTAAGAPGPGRGITADFDDNIWMTCNDTANSVVKYDPSGGFLGTWSTSTFVPIGIGTANDGNMIAVSAAASTWRKINKNTGANIPLPPYQFVGAAPYTYSDFTGSLRNLVALQQGIWTVVTDGGSNNLVWNLISWNAATPPGTALTVEARAAYTLPALASLAWTNVPTSGPLGSPLYGRYIETRVRLKRTVECGQPFVTPVLYDIHVEADCDPCVLVGCPDTTIVCESQAGATFYYDAPAVTGGCDSTYTITCTPPSGSLFPIGSTPVVCTATNALGDTLECSFLVTVTGDCYSPITGACCEGDLCFDATEADCLAGGGIYYGDGSNCQDGCEFSCLRPPHGMVAWFPFDNSNATNAVNLVNPASPGTLINTPTPVSGQYVNNAYSFDGSSEYVDVPDWSPLDIGYADFTIDAWVKTSAGAATIVDKRQGTEPIQGIQGYAFYLSNGYPGLQMAVGGSWGDYVLSAGNGGAPAFVADGAWHHVAVTVDRNNPLGGRFYVDGVPVGSTFNPTPFQGDLGSAANLWIARGYTHTGPAVWLSGELDEVEIFNRELTPAEVSGMALAGTSGKCRDACYAPRRASGCSQGAVSTAFTICNYDVVGHTYSYGMGPANSGPGCVGLGANSFSPASGTIYVPAGSCVSVPVTIVIPTGVAVGQESCYQVSIFNHDTGNLFGCFGSVRKPKWWCISWVDPVGIELTGLARVAPGAVIAPKLAIKHISPLPVPVDLAWRLVPMSWDETTPSTVVSINGREPGMEVGGVAQIAGSDPTEIPLTISLTDQLSLGYDRILLYADDDMDGVDDLIGEFAVTGEVPVATGIVGDTPDERGRSAHPFLALPNPFSPSAHIEFRLGEGEGSKVHLRLFDLQGRLVKTFYRSGRLPAGDHRVQWDGRDDWSQSVPNGVYFLKLETPVSEERVKIVLMR